MFGDWDLQDLSFLYIKWEAWTRWSSGGGAEPRGPCTCVQHLDDGPESDAEPVPVGVTLTRKSCCCFLSYVSPSGFFPVISIEHILVPSNFLAAKDTVVTNVDQSPSKSLKRFALLNKGIWELLDGVADIPPNHKI